MPNKNRYERQFFAALQDIFVGAKVEGDSGFVNLMRIKARYYEQGVFPHLKADIDTALIPFPDFREELFDKLYTFFSRYFSESGSIYFRHTPNHQNIYEKVYTDDRDVMLFWKTHMLYYVKTDRIFTSLRVEVDDLVFFFDAGQMKLKRANEKREVIYSFVQKAQDGSLHFSVEYSERGKTTKVDDILRELRQAGVKLEEDTLTRAFRVFEKQSEVDFFINKNARAFLEEQFDLWMYQYLFAGQNVWRAERLAQLQTLKTIATKIIAFIAQFEDELVRIWNKPKFVRNSHYVITLDKISDETLLDKLLNHPGMTAQIQEWVELGMVESGFEPNILKEKDLAGEILHRQFKYLPFDTLHFPDLELSILALFEDLDQALDGWLIHSENFQAINNLISKHHQLIDLVYIDPPYNAESTEIIYENAYKHSSWLSLMENRITLSKPLMSKKCVYVCAIDEIEQEALGLLFSSAFPNWNKSCITVVHNATGQQGLNFSTTHEYAYFIFPKNGRFIGLENRSSRPDIRPLRNVSKGSHLRTDAANCFYPIFVKNGEIIGFGEVSNGDFHPNNINISREDGVIEVYPIDSEGVERKWVFARNTVESILDELEAKYDKNKKIWDIIRTKKRFNFKSVWTDSKYSANSYGSRILNEILPNNNFSFPKSIHTTVDCIDAGLNNINAGTIFDYFAGSGTTAHAVMNLNRADNGKRKYILVEMGEHFNTVILPRIKKVAFNSKWKNGKPVFEKNESGMSQFVKYFDLEQYEDTLRRAYYGDTDLFHNPYEDPYHQYIFQRDEKMLDALEVDYTANQVHFHPERVYPDIDLAETLSNLRGKWIKRITEDLVEFADGEQISLKNPDWRMLKPLIWW